MLKRVLICIFLMTTCTATSADLRTGLIALWKAENNANDSANEHSGVLMNGATFAGGKFGQAFSLSGNAYVSFPTSSDWNFGANDFTIGGWFFLNNSYDHKTIFASENDYKIGIFILGSGKIGYFASSTGYNWNLLSGDSDHQNGIGLAKVTTNTWHHIVFIKNGNNWKGYL